MKNRIVGHGGGGDEGGAQHVPYEAPDSLRSRSTVKLIDAISEGPIKGLLDGLRSIKLNGTPLRGHDTDDGRAHYNFQNIDAVLMRGTQNQNSVPGFSETQTDTRIALEVTSIDNVDVSHTINDLHVDRAIITLGFPALSFSTTEGDLIGTDAGVDIYVNEVLAYSARVSGKSTTHYQESYPIELAPYGAGPWTIRCTRPPSLPTSALTTKRNKSYFDIVTAVTDGKLRYPNTAYMAVSTDAQSFTSLPVRSYVIQGLLVRIPDTYTPRKYNPPVYHPKVGDVAGYETPGYWTPAVWAETPWLGGDANWKVEWTDNPAWCFYDLLTNERYGAGGYIDEELSDQLRWSLYPIGKYCDELVPSGRKDGSGNPILEPRFSCNMVLQTQEDAYRVIANFASIFRGMTYWAAGSVWAVQDCPTDPTYLFTEANVVDGMFSYSGSARRARHNVVTVAWNDPEDGYKQKIEYVQDDESILKFGRLIQTDVVAVGCTSQGQANRVGRWLIYTEQYEDETIVFKTGYEGVRARPGDIIKVQDQSRVSTRFGGRVISATATSIVLDAPVTLAAGQFYSIWVVMPNGELVQRPVLTAAPITTDTLSVIEFDEVNGIVPLNMTSWILSGSNLEPQTFRVLGVQEVEKDTFQITALKHLPGKYAYIEQGLVLDIPADRSIGSSGTVGTNLPVVTGIEITELYCVHANLAQNVVHINWDPVPDAREYVVLWMRDNGSWVKLAGLTAPSTAIYGALPGIYFVRVSAIMANGISTMPTNSRKTILGKVALPSNVTGFSATVGLVTVELRWNAIPDADLDSYDVRYGTDWATGTSIVKDSAATKFTWQRPTAQGVYVLWIKALDTSGGYSATAATVSITLDAGVEADSVLTMAEKPRVILEYNTLVADYTLLSGKAIATGTEYAAYSAAFVALQEYMGSLTPAYTLITADTPIVATEWRTAWQTYYNEETALVIRLGNAPPVSIGLISTANHNLTTNAALPVVDSSTTAIGDHVALVAQTVLADNALYSVAVESVGGGGGTTYTFPTSVALSYTGAGLGTLDDPTNTYDNTAGAPNLTTTGLLSPFEDTDITSSTDAVWSGWTGTGLTGNLVVALTPYPSVDGPATAFVVVYKSLDGGTTYTTAATFNVLANGVPQTLEIPITNATGANLRVKIRVYDKHTVKKTYDYEGGYTDEFYWATSSAIIKSVHLSAGSGGTDNFKFVKLSDIPTGSIYKVQGGATHGGKVYSIVMATDNAATLVEQTYDPTAYDINCYASGKPLASAKILMYQAPRAFTLNSIGHTGVAGVAGAADRDFLVQKNGSTIGTLRFTATTGAFSIVSFTTTGFSISDVLSIVAPASQDATLADIGIVLRGSV